jgi:hypothetical protein
MPRPDLAHRMHLLEANRSAVMVMLAKAVATGKAVEELVAVVADTRDSVGGDLTRALADKVPGLDADAEAARAQARGEIPTLVAIVPVRAAVEVFAIPNPGVSAGIEQAVVPGRVRVVLVGAGGSTLVSVPVEKMTGGGDA